MLFILISLVSISFVIAVYQMLEFLKNGTQYYAVWTTDTFLIWFTSAFQAASIVYEI